MVASHTNQSKLQNVYKQDRNLFSCFTKYKWLPTIKMIQPSIFLSTEGKQLEFWGCFEGGNYFGSGNTNTLWLDFLQKSIIHSTTIQVEILQINQEVEFINQDCRKKYCKIPKRHRCFLTQNILININQLRMRRGRTRKVPTLQGGMKQWHGTDVHIKSQQWLEPILLKMKIISSTTQQCRPFQEEEYIAPQRLDICAPIFLTWDPQWKHMW